MSDMEKKCKPPRRIDPFFHNHMNIVVLTGAICNDPVYFPPEDNKGSMSAFLLCYFPAEYDERKKGWHRKGEFINACCHGEDADTIARICGKNTVVTLTGSLRQRTYPDGKYYSIIYSKSMCINWNLNHKDYYLDQGELTMDEMFLDELSSERDDS